MQDMVFGVVFLVRIEWEFLGYNYSMLVLQINIIIISFIVQDS